VKYFSILLLMLTVSAAYSIEGDIRTRIWRRFPDCRGTLGGEYTGDEYSLYNRIRISAGGLDLSLLMDKNRGEDWVDIIAGGCRWNSSSSPFTSVSAGWLKSKLGSGVIFSYPGSWTGVDNLNLCKPPGIRDYIRLATSSWGIRGEPMTGIGTQLSVGTYNLSVLSAYSKIDGSGEGYHRTPSEIADRVSITELLGVFRLSIPEAGITAAVIRRAFEDDSTSLVYRGGVDWRLNFEDFLISGEAGIGQFFVDTVLSFAGWAALTQNLDLFKHNITIYRLPEGFPETRASFPIGTSCDFGAGYGFRFRPFERTTFSAGVRTQFIDDEYLLKFSGEIQQRLEGRLLFTLGGRNSGSEDDNSYRLWLKTTWDPGRKIHLSAKVQATGWQDSESDSSETGTGGEFRLRYDLNSQWRLWAGAIAFSTRGYNSRIYAAEIVFPGEFGSVSLWDSGFMLQGAVSLSIPNGFKLTARGYWKNFENLKVIGSGWEETVGNSRYGAGLQVDYSFGN